MSRPGGPAAAHNRWSVEREILFGWHTRVRVDLLNEVFRHSQQWGIRPTSEQVPDFDHPSYWTSPWDAASGQHIRPTPPVADFNAQGDLAATLAFFDESGELVEYELADLRDAPLRDHFGTTYCLPHCPPLFVLGRGGHDGFVDLDVFSHTEILLPWCENRGESGLGDYVDNRALADLNGGRLNGFLGHLRELASQSGHDLELDRKRTVDEVLFQLDDLGVRLDAEIDHQRTHWAWFGDSDQPQLCDAVLEAIDTVEAHPAQPPYFTVLRLRCNNDNHALSRAGRDVVRDVLRSGRVGERLARSPEVRWIEVELAGWEPVVPPERESRRPSYIHRRSTMSAHTFICSELLGPPEGDGWRAYVLLPGGNINRWRVMKYEYLAWETKIDEQWLMDVLRSGERHDLFRVGAVPWLGYDRAASGMRFADFVVGRGLDRVDAFNQAMFCTPVRMAYYAPDGTLVDRDVDDLGATLAAGVHEGYPHTGRPALDINADRTSDGCRLTVDTYSDIWLPWLPEDNRELAELNSRRLSAFLADIDEIASRSGGSLQLESEMRHWVQFPRHDLGVQLDYLGPDLWITWRQFGSPDDPELPQLGDALLAGAAEVRLGPHPLASSAVCAWAKVPEDGPLFGDRRRAILAALRATGVGASLTDLAYVLVRVDRLEHSFSPDELTS